MPFRSTRFRRGCCVGPEVAQAKGTRCTCKYGIDLEYTRGTWPTGPKQSGLFFDSTPYSVTKALFIVSTGVRGAPASILRCRSAGTCLCLGILFGDR